jgi:hypothetical protein
LQISSESHLYKLMVLRDNKTVCITLTEARYDFFNV